MALTVALLILLVFICMYCYLYGSAVRNLPTDAGDAGLIPGPERSPGEGNGNPLQFSCLENPIEEEEMGYRWRSLVGYSPWGHKESDTTE